MADVAFLGLGVMGGPMAGHLSRAGHNVTVWNRSSDKTSAWYQDYQGKIATTPSEAVTSSEFVLMCLGDDPDVREVFDKIESAIRHNSYIIDHTTDSPSLARELATRTSARGASFIDAPVSGGQAGAESGTLTIMCGGNEKAFERAKPIMSAYARNITRIGDSGTGQLTKACNQLAIAGVLQGLSEALVFAQDAELDISLVIEAISGGAAQSWQMENRWKTMVNDEFEFGFAVDWMRKDLRIALETAREQGTSLPLAALIDQFYADVQAMGGNRWDTSSLIRRLTRLPK